MSADNHMQKTTSTWTQLLLLLTRRSSIYQSVSYIENNKLVGVTEISRRFEWSLEVARQPHGTDNKINTGADNLGASALQPPHRTQRYTTLLQTLTFKACFTWWSWFASRTCCSPQWLLFDTRHESTEQRIYYERDHTI